MTVRATPITCAAQAEAVIVPVSRGGPGFGVHRPNGIGRARRYCFTCTLMVEAISGPYDRCAPSANCMVSV